MDIYNIKQTINRNDIIDAKPQSTLYGHVINQEVVTFKSKKKKIFYILSKETIKQYI